MHAVQSESIDDILHDVLGTAAMVQPKVKSEARLPDRPATEREEALALALQEARACVKGWKTRADAIQDALFKLTGRASTVSRPGGGKILQVNNQDGQRLDIKRLRADHPELRSILDQYMVGTEGGSYIRVTG